MRISTKVVLDLESLVVISRESYEYDGPVDRCCGGDSLANQKKTEANQQIQLQQYMMDLMKQYQGQTTPFWTSRLNGGLPFFNALTDYNKGTIAQSFAPGRAAMERNLAGFGDTLPSGFKLGAETNFNEGEGQAFDQSMVNSLMANENVKEQAAANLNPFQPAQLSSNAAGSVLSAPPVNAGGFGNFLGGAVSGVLNAAGSAASGGNSLWSGFGI